MIDQAVLDLLQDEVADFICPCAAVVEVGPGLGVLTQELVDPERYDAGPVLAVERDPILAQHLATFVSAPESKLQVIQADILETLDRNPDFPFVSEVVAGKSNTALRNPRDILESVSGGCSMHATALQKRWMVVANIPYAITSPLVRKLFYRANPPQHAFLMVQKEAAERIVAQPGDSSRGLLSVLIQIKAGARIIRDGDKVRVIKPESFWPQPTVDSVLIHLKPHSESLVADEDMDAVTRVVIAGFSAKRKQLANSLAGGLGLSVVEAKQLLEKAAVDPTRRAETLTIEEWKTLAKLVR